MITWLQRSLVMGTLDSPVTADLLVTPNLRIPVASRSTVREISSSPTLGIIVSGRSHRMEKSRPSPEPAVLDSVVMGGRQSMLNYPLHWRSQSIRSGMCTFWIRVTRQGWLYRASPRVAFVGSRPMDALRHLRGILAFRCSMADQQLPPI